MSWDRELWIDTFYNVTKFKQAGLPVETRWSTAIVGSAENWWLNPQDKKAFGDNARYYEYNVSEAKKLVSAAAGAAGVQADAHYILTNQYGRDFQKQIEVLMQMGAEAGIKLTTVPSDYNVDWDPKYRAAKPPGNFDGVAWINMTLSEEPGAWLFSVFNSKGALFKGFDPDGKSNFNGDPAMEDLTVKLKSEFDTQKRWALAHDLQRLEAKKQYMTPFPGGASGYLLAWPALQNFRVYRGIQQLPELYYWIDSKKKPLAS
jgi:ABC-type transport system substrate-binding protein